VDRGIELLESNPEATWKELEPRLKEVMNSEPTPYLTDPETAELNRYLAENRPRLQPIIDHLNATADPSPTAFTNGETCAVYCLLFFLVTCDAECLVGACIGLWDCADGHTVSLPDCDECDEEVETPCSDDDDCPEGFRCAKWVFKENECVQTCEDDEDCPEGQECKRPFGTRFKRCK
jgi:hypothetical protein